MKLITDYKKVFEVLVSETADYLLKNNIKAQILGISGGIDSTVTAAICHEVSKQTGIPLIGRSLPIKNKEDEFNTSKLVGEAFCDDFKIVNLSENLDDFIITIQSAETKFGKFGIFAGNWIQTPITNGNIQARFRMIYLYNLASLYKGLVLSTDNQTEYQLGFWTLHGDVGDFNPLQDLWKTEVYDLAGWLSDYYKELKYYQKYEAINWSIGLTPTDGLGISNSDLDQIGAESYSEVDNILQDFLAFAEDYKNKKNAVEDYLEYNALYDIEPEVIKKVLNKHLNSEFKRKHLPIYIERKKYEN